MAKQDNKNPLAGHFRSPKLYTSLPSGGAYYSDKVIDQGMDEHAVYPMTAKDEMIMKNPDALLNGDAVVQVIQSCIPSVKNARRLFSNDVDAMMVAIQGATFGDDVEVTANCDKCEKECKAILSAEGILTTMTELKDSYEFTTESGLLIKIQPFSYNSAVKAGVASFRSTRSLQSITDIPDELERVQAFSENFLELAQLNFSLMVDSVRSITVKDGDDIVEVADQKQIQEFLENCDAGLGREIQTYIEEIGKVGINKRAEVSCETCGTEEDPYVFESEVNFNPVNFFTAS
jgi:hypothetical protein